MRGDGGYCGGGGGHRGLVEATTLEKQLKWIGTIFCVKNDKIGSIQAHCSQVEGSGSVKGTRSDNVLPP